jgi:outer membrane protein TolC
MAAAKAQSIDLYTCLDSAKTVMPLLKQKPLLQQELQNKLAIYSNTYLPALSANGQASYQSDVPSLPFKIPGFSGLNIPKDQYKMYLQLSQPIYDAGMSKAQKEVATASTATSLQQLEVSLNAYQQQIVTVYFQTLLAEAQINIVRETIGVLQQKEQSVNGAYQNGAGQQNDVLNIQASIIDEEKNLASLQNAETTGLQILSLLTGIDTRNKTLQIPASVNNISYDITKNPSLVLINTEQKNVLASNDLYHSERLPHISLFGQAGMGDPNPYNFFKSSNSPFYIAGVQANWNIWDWHTSARERDNLQLQSQMLEAEKEQTTMNINTTVIQLTKENDYLQQMLLKDDTLISLKKQIRDNAAHQLDEGVITSNDYLQDVVDAQQAEIQQQIDQLNINKNQILLQLENGNL